MRNLKKVLALVLALVMAMSLLTIATAADFSDDADIDYSEAVDVMVAAGIIDGVGNNSFDPNGTLTREQAAKLITYMLLGENSEKLGVEGTSFKDVAATRWSAPAIEYCASMGIIDGAGDGNFYPAGKLTGYAFAKMLLTALGYKSDREGFTGANWSINVATKALSEDVRLDAGLEKMFGSAELSRQEAAQMALNAICAPIVEYDGNSVEVNGTTINIGNTGARFVTTTIANQQSISDRKLTNSGSSNDKSGYTVELGEKYLPKLERREQTDDFGRPAYTWSYDKKEIGSYLDESDLVATYTSKVTGKDLFEAITKANLDDAGKNFIVYIDGEYENSANSLVFPKSDVSRSNTEGVGGTEKGVLTQAFVQKDFDNDETNIIITIINTYLAIATEDYDSKNEDVSLDVYALNKTDAHTSKNPDYIKDRDNESFTVTVKNEDIDVTEVKEDDKFLVTVADGKVQTMVAPEIVADASIDSFKLHKDVTVEGKTYEYAHTAKYDVDVLDDYSKTNLKDTTYNIVLDKYGYLIGIEQNEDPDQYVFLTGMEGNGSDLSTKNADANVIFLDGRMETITVNVSKSDDSLMSSNGPLMNTWCTYSVDNKGVYTLKEVAKDAFPAKGTKVAQSAMDANGVGDDDEIVIDKKNVSLTGLGTAKVYGNNDTVYLAVSTKAIKAATNAETDPDQEPKHWHAVINDVDSVTVGTRNVSLVAPDQVAGDGSKKEVANVGDTDGPVVSDAEVYPLFKDNGYIIAAVVIGEDDGVSKSFAYIHSDGVKRERYNKADDEWTWVREAIVDGKIVDLTEVGGGTDLSELEDMDQGKWYEIKFDADGNVKDAIEQDFTGGTADTAEALERINEVLDVEKSVNKYDTVILQQAGMAGGEDSKLTYKNGTLFTTEDEDEALGFSVSPDVKVVLCLSDGSGHLSNHTNDGCFDECDDKYEGYKGLENAIRNLDENFVGELNVVFDKGDAVVIILVDQTEDDEANNGGGGTGVAEPQGNISIGGDFVKTPAASTLTGDANTGDSNQATIKGWNDGAYVLPKSINKNTVLNNDINGDLDENMIFKYQATANPAIANLEIKDENGKTVYKEQANFSSAAAGHFFVVRVIYKSGSGEPWYATTNSVGSGPLTRGPLAKGNYTWEITGTGVQAVDGEFTIK